MSVKCRGGQLSLFARCGDKPKAGKAAAPSCVDRWILLLLLFGVFVDGTEKILPVQRPLPCVCPFVRLTDLPKGEGEVATPPLAMQPFSLLLMM